MTNFGILVLLGFSIYGLLVTLNVIPLPRSLVKLGECGEGLGEKPCYGKSCSAGLKIVNGVCGVCGDLDQVPCPEGCDFGLENVDGRCKVREEQRCGAYNKEPCEDGSCEGDLEAFNGICMSCGRFNRPPCSTGCDEGLVTLENGLCGIKKAGDTSKNDAEEEGLVFGVFPVPTFVLIVIALVALLAAVIGLVYLYFRKKSWLMQVLSSRALLFGFGTVALGILGLVFQFIGKLEGPGYTIASYICFALASMLGAAASFHVFLSLKRFVGDYITKKATDIRDYVVDSVNGAAESAREKLQSIQDRITRGVDDLGKAVDDIADTILDVPKNLKDAVKEAVKVDVVGNIEELPREQWVDYIKDDMAEVLGNIAERDVVLGLLNKEDPDGKEYKKILKQYNLEKKDVENWTEEKQKLDETIGEAFEDFDPSQIWISMSLDYDQAIKEAEDKTRIKHEENTRDYWRKLDEKIVKRILEKAKQAGLPKSLKGVVIDEVHEKFAKKNKFHPDTETVWQEIRKTYRIKLPSRKEVSDSLNEGLEDTREIYKRTKAPQESRS